MVSNATSDEKLVFTGGSSDGSARLLGKFVSTAGDSIS